MATSRIQQLTIAIISLAAIGDFAGCKKRNASTQGAPAVAIPWSANATAYRTQVGAMLTVECPPNGQAGSVWGTDAYTTDSSICTAAVHSGRIQLQTGGIVAIQIAPGMPRYQGSLRGGIASFNFAAYVGTFTIVGGAAPGMIAVPVPGMSINANGLNIGGLQINVGSGNGADAADPWRTNGTSHRTQIGTSFVHVCPPGGTLGSAWGTGIFSDDSSLCTAAVHAGRLQQAAGGPINVFVHPGRSNYQGSVANGVTTRDFGRFSGSFSFDAVAPPEMAVPAGTEPLSWTSTGTAFRARTTGIVRVFCPPGAATASVWGSQPFTADSSVCAAAVHQGTIRPETGGSFGLRMMRGLPVYRGSVRNGVTSRDFAQFAGSFLVVR